MNIHERWTVTGHNRPVTTPEKLVMLREIMLDTRLNDIERRICWFLIMELMNSTTSLCFCSNQTLAAELKIGLTSVKRAKRSLRAKAILDWSTEKAGDQNEVSLYWLLKRLEGRQRPYLQHQSGPTPRAASGPTPRTASGPSGYHAKPCSAEYIAWETHYRANGRSIPQNRHGWTFPSRWPPD